MMLVDLMVLWKMITLSAKIRTIVLYIYLCNFMHKITVAHLMLKAFCTSRRRLGLYKSIFVFKVVFFTVMYNQTYFTVL